MSESDTYSKMDRLQKLQLLFWRNQGKRYRTRDIADLLQISVDTASRYLNELSRDGRLPVLQDGWDWYLPQGAKFEVLPLKLTLPEAASLHLAGRLLVLTQNRRNQHIMSALTKLVAVMPETIAPHQHALIDMLRERQSGQGSVSDVFEALTLGWATRRKLRLHYSPQQKRSFECHFSPYLLEPSGIGRTIYALGRSSLANEFRTFKLERIDYAELLIDTFEIEPDFDGPALLKRAWGVMYGDEECVEVRLRFSHRVTKRLKETLWHPSQQMKDTPEGCEWSAMIGDTLEIENWIRGWGADCEVLTPQSLRQQMLNEARRLAHMYGMVTEKTTPPEEPDIDLLSHIFGG